MCAQAARRTQVERRSDTEHKVLDAAINLIARNGSRNVSLADVGASAGYSRGIVNHQFGSKDQLLEAVVRSTQQFDVPDTGETALERLTVLITTYLASLPERAPGWQAFLVLWTESVVQHGSPLSAVYADRDMWFRTLLARHVRDGIADGSIRADADADTIALTVLGMLRGICLQLMSSADQTQVDQTANQVADLIQRGLARN
jgi:AcrR family transcriptional regulator